MHAYIRQRADGAWRVEWVYAGDRRPGNFMSCTYPAKKLGDETAKKLADTAKRLVESRNLRITSDEVDAAVLGIDTDVRARNTPTLGQYLPEWIAARRDADEIQSTTLDDYSKLLNLYAAPYLGEHRLDLITPETITAWLKWLRTKPTRSGKPLAAGTITKVHAVIHTVLGDASVAGHMPANPCAKPPGRRKATPGLPRKHRYQAFYFTRAEADLVLANCSPAIRDLVFVALHTGMRLGELLALRVGDLNLSSKRPTITIRRALKRDGSQGEPKSERSRRTITIDDATVEILAKLAKGRRPTALVFTTPTGKMWNPANLRNQYWAAAVGAARRCPQHPPQLPDKGPRGPRRGWRPDEVSTCDCPGVLHVADHDGGNLPRIHDCRHTHVAWLIAEGKHIVWISRRLGHSSIQITADVYGGLIADVDPAAVDRFAEYPIPDQRLPRTVRTRNRLATRRLVRVRPLRSAE